MRVTYLTPNRFGIHAQILSDYNDPKKINNIYVISYTSTDGTYYPYTDIQRHVQQVGMIQVYKNSDGIIGFDLTDPKFDAFGKFDIQSLTFERKNEHDFNRNFMPIYQYDFLDIWTLRMMYGGVPKITIDELINALIASGINNIRFYDILHNAHFIISNDIFEFQWNCRETMPLVLQYLDRDSIPTLQETSEIKVLVDRINQGSIQMIIPKYLELSAREYTEQFFSKYIV